MATATLNETLCAIAESTQLFELDAVAMPLIKASLAADRLALIEFDANGRPGGLAGDLLDAEPAVYFEHFFDSDPIRASARRADGPIATPVDTLSRTVFESSEAFTDYYRPRRFDGILCARMLAPNFFEPGMVCLVGFRAPATSRFGEREQRFLAGVLPAMTATARRHRRLQQVETVRALLETWLEAADPTPRFMVNRELSVVWCSPTAKSQLDAGLFDAAVRSAAHSLIALAETKKNATPVFAVATALGDVELRLDHDPHGVITVIAEIHAPKPSTADRLATLARAHRLTRSETQVLDALTRGLANEDIAAAHFISLATVKTHVHHILLKLGVKSRLQAALLVNDPKCHPNQGTQQDE